MPVIKALITGAVSLVVLSGLPRAACSANFIVKDGQSRAEIVIAEQAVPATRLAAAELQTNLFKITGATLPVVTRPDPACPVQVYVGRSAHTDALKVTEAGLKDGAFRIVSGDRWLVLLGHDSRFTPPEPFMRSRADTERALKAWDQATGAHWEHPYNQLWKSHNAALDIWEQDERGSFNAVCEFLRMQGVRWYLPEEELGTIMPRRSSIELPVIDRTVRPDFALRYPYQYGRRFAGASREELLWQCRMGFAQAPDVIGVGYIAHGIPLVISRDEVKKAHPEYYALSGGVRQNGDKIKPCLSSEGLFQENVKFVRAVFDIFGAPMVSVMPSDGFTAACQCDLCKGKGTPERGWMGQYSDYVWDYVDRVAREVYKTHPNKKVVGMAYTTYLLPPTRIQRFSPNVVVCMAQNRGDLSANPEMRKTFDEARKRYVELLPAGEKAFCVYEYYRAAVPGKAYQAMPVFYPHAVAADLRQLRDYSFGDYVEVHREPGLTGFAATALNLYVTGRFWWDATQDVDALLEEYYTLFYGPARDEMKAFIEYSEANWKTMNKDAGAIDQAFSLLAQARQKAPADSVYGRRIALVADYIEPMRGLGAQLAKGRDQALKVRARTLDAKDIRLDGKLDDVFWKGVPGYGSGRLQDALTGKPSKNGTSFKVAWAGDSLYFGITCVDRDMTNLVVGTAKHDDPAILTGDHVELLFETQTHCYYQLAIAPSGAVLDADRKQGGGPAWSSDAEVAAFKGDGFWSLEVRIPVAGELQGNIDALNGVAGRKPTVTYPWFFNIGRQRVRGKSVEFATYSPASPAEFARPEKFAKLDMR